MTHYDYSDAKQYCQQIGLVWLGDDFPALIHMDADAEANGMTQAQVDIGMRHHLSQVAYLFNPKSYRWPARLGIALYFLTGWKPKLK